MEEPTVCPDCQGRGATAPDGVQYCNCDDTDWLKNHSHDDLRKMLTEAWEERDRLVDIIYGLRKAIRKRDLTQI